jgi:hypothetical protein
MSMSGLTLSFFGGRVLVHQAHGAGGAQGAPRARVLVPKGQRYGGVTNPRPVPRPRAVTQQQGGQLTASVCVLAAAASGGLGYSEVTAGTA